MSRSLWWDLFSQVFLLSLVSNVVDKNEANPYLPVRMASTHYVPFCRIICYDCHFIKRYLSPQKDATLLMSRVTFFFRLRDTLKSHLDISDSSRVGGFFISSSSEKICSFFPSVFSVISLKWFLYEISLTQNLCLQISSFFHISTSSPSYFNWWENWAKQLRW